MNDYSNKYIFLAWVIIALAVYSLVDILIMLGGVI